MVDPIGAPAPEIKASICDIPVTFPAVQIAHTTSVYSAPLLSPEMVKVEAFPEAKAAAEGLLISPVNCSFGHALSSYVFVPLTSSLSNVIEVSVLPVDLKFPIFVLELQAPPTVLSSQSASAGAAPAPDGLVYALESINLSSRKKRNKKKTPRNKSRRFLNDLCV